MKKTILCLLASFLFSCTHSPEKANEGAVGQYQAKAAELISASRKRTTPAKKMEELGIELIGLAKPIIQQFQKRHPNCRPFLDHVLEKSMHMTTLSLEKIESDYHDGDALPKSPDKCYEAKELIVHPATVVVLARKQYDREGRIQMVDEIEEVLAHIEELQ